MDHPQRGFIALITSIILSTILLGLALTAGTSGVFARYGALHGEYKRVSLAFAESCANSALLKIAQDYNYAPAVGGDTVQLGVDGQGRAETCVIKTVTYGTENSIHQRIAVITTQSQYPSPNGAVSTITVSSSVQNPQFAIPARATIVVQTTTLNDDGGTKQPGDFVMSVTGGNASPNGFSGSATGVVVYVDPGSYNVSGASDGTYTKTTSASCSGTVNAGDVVSCTVGYDDVPTTGMLTVIANVKNDNGGTKVPSDFQLFIDGALSPSGVPMSGLDVTTHTVTAGATPAGYMVSAWGTDCSSSGGIYLAAGYKKTCTIVYDDVPPPAPICVDTVLMLDRTGSMGGSDLTDERTAANGLLSLYSVLSPLPKSAVGVFGAINANEPYNAAILQGLTTTYSALTSAVNTGLSNSNGYTNLASAINSSQTEFINNGTPGKGHVLILLSDGGANRPTTNAAGNTGFKSPTTNSQNATGDAWTNPAGAYGGGSASDAAGHRQRYAAHGLSVPASATINGIEVQVTASSTAAAVGPQTVTIGDATNTGSYDQWSTNFFLISRVAAVSSNNGDSSYITSSANNAETYEFPGAGLPTGSVISSVTVTAVARGTAVGAGIRLRAEKGTGVGSQNDSATQTLSTSYANYTQTWNTNPFTSAAWTLSEVNSWSTNFGVLRTSGTVRVTQVFITVTYTPPPATCVLGVDLSYDAGAHWTSEDTQMLSTTNQTFVLGGTTDTWGRTWSPNDFSDTNFRVRIHDTNPGPSCRVDALQTRVSYTTAVDPDEAAYAAADAAKLAGTEIFTIHFGDRGTNDSDINFLARLAGGTTSNAPHQNGSVNDLSSGVQSGNSGYVSPAADAADTGGDGNGFELSPSNAYADGGGAAQNANGAGDRHKFSGYSFSIPASATITGIETRLDWYLDSTSGSNSMKVELSWNGGASWTTVSRTSTDESTSNNNSDTVGGTTDTWGRTWSPADFIAGKFMVRLTSNSDNSSRDFYLDWVPVRVSYTLIPENGDNDNFFVSPTSADMANIFQTIGQKVCPALVAPPVAPLPTRGTLYVITHVINDNGGLSGAADFSMNVTGTNATPAAFTGSAAPGTVVTLDPGTFDVQEDLGVLLYSKTSGAGCSGTIAAGQVLTCTITNDDLPPPPGSAATPIPPSNIIIGSWTESP